MRPNASWIARGSVSPSHLIRSSRRRRRGAWKLEPTARAIDAGGRARRAPARRSGLGDRLHQPKPDRCQRGGACWLSHYAASRERNHRRLAHSGRRGRAAATSRPRVRDLRKSPAGHGGGGARCGSFGARARSIAPDDLATNFATCGCGSPGPLKHRTTCTRFRYSQPSDDGGMATTAREFAQKHYARADHRSGSAP